MDERLDEWQALARPEYSVPILEELKKVTNPERASGSYRVF
jgi:hypothetical protein